MTKSEYKFSTDLDEIDLGRLVMPLRSNRADARDICGVDIAFLGEAACEMNEVLGVDMGALGAPRISMKDRRLLASRPASIARAFASATNTNRRIMTNGDPLAVYEGGITTVYSGTNDEAWWYFADHPEFWASVKVSPSWQSNPADFVVGAEVAYEPIMRMFRDSQRVKSVARLPSQGSGFVADHEITYAVTRGGHHYDSPDSFLRYHDSFDFNSSGYWELSGWVHSVVNGGYYATVEEFAKAGVPVTARLFVAVRTNYHFYGRADVTYIDVARLNAKRMGARFGVTATQMAALTESIKARHGIQEPHAVPSQGSTANYTCAVRMSARDWAIQLVRGDHTLINGWTP